MRHTRAFILACTLALLALACTDDTILHTYRSTSSQGWKRLDTMSFAIPAQSQGGSYALDMGMRVTCGFPYQDIWVVVEQRWADSIGNRLDTIRYELTDELEELNGKGLNMLQYEHRVAEIDIRPDIEGEVRIRHIMTKEIIPNVHDVGIHIHK